VRGAARSHSEETVLAQITKLAANGFGEFILTGTNVGSYGKDHGNSMATLLKKVSQIRGVRRIRIGSLEPIQIDDAFKELLSEPWMAKHLHIALQHTSDKMLEMMNRRNSFATDKKLFEELSEAGYALGTDFIVGHPGEDEVVWMEAMERLVDLPLTHVHAFSYSKRDGTVAATMSDTVLGNIAKARHRELTALIAEKNYQFRRAHAEGLEVLLERGEEGIFSGLDQYFNRIIVKSDEELSGNWVLLDEVLVEKEGNKACFGSPKS
jgi:MiaB/RimO family radical SAM methylthiotransferase